MKKTNTTPPGDLSAVQTAIRSAQSEHARVEQQRNSLAASLAYIDRSVDSWGVSGSGALHHGMARLATGEMPRLLQGRVSADGTADFGPLMCALLGADAVRDRLHAAAREVIPEGLDREARAHRLAAIAAEIEALEVAEERLVRQTEVDGVPVLRRPDCNPAIVLAP